MKKQIIMVTGLPRTGLNLVTRIVELLGVPGPEVRGRLKKITPSGYFTDIPFRSGKVDREAPWVFKNSGFASEEEAQKFLDMSNLVVIECRRDQLAIQRSLHRAWCIQNEMDPKEWTFDKASKSVRHYVRKWSHRGHYFLSRWNGPRFIVSFEGLIAKPRRYVRRISSFLGVEPLDKAIKLVNPKWAHFKPKV